MGQEGSGYDCELIASSAVVGYSSHLAAKFMLPLGPTGGVEVRGLLGRVDLFVVDRKGSCRMEDRGMGTVMRTKEERRRV